MTKQHYDGIAGIYDSNRPAYPPDLVRHFRELCPIPDGGGIIPEGGGIILDVGSGTGISTRQLRQLFPHDVAVIGIEPGDDMRRMATANFDRLIIIFCPK